MRFTIRDVLWLTVVVAMGVAWWIEHRSMAHSLNMAQEAARELEKTTGRHLILEYPVANPAGTR